MSSHVTFTPVGLAGWPAETPMTLYFDVSEAVPSRTPERHHCTALGGRRETSGLYAEETVSVTVVEIVEADLPQWEAFVAAGDCGAPMTLDISDTCTPHWLSEREVTLESANWIRIEDCCEHDLSLNFRADIG